MLRAPTKPTGEFGESQLEISQNTEIRSVIQLVAYVGARWLWKSFFIKGTSESLLQQLAN